MTDPITVHVSIQGSYAVTPEQAEEAYGSQDPTTIAALDQKSFDEGRASVQDVLTWLEDSDDLTVAITGPKAMPDEDNRIFMDHVLHALCMFDYRAYGADHLPLFDDVEGGPSEMARDLAKEVASTVSGYFAARAHTFSQAPDDDTTAHVIARVLRHISGEMALAYRQPAPEPEPDPESA